MSNSIFSKFSFSRFTAAVFRPPLTVEQQVNALYGETHEQLLASLRRMLEPAQAEEVLQEAYLKLFIALQEDRTLEPRPFLFRVARNLAISVLRHQKVVEQHGISAQHDLQEATQVEAVESQITREEEQRALLAAINALPPKCRQVFVMRKIDGHSHEDIARILGISNKTVENHLAKGMRLCREHLVAARTAQTPPAAAREEREEIRLAAG
ncbi:RNA polymerase sigma factor [Microbulbifer guangxiensis]|uniref:RNA polymerase sigma factor n=1 Tax=Microbulbifer guangxiensis TaxID=2904249 RepID=UPI001F0067B0|nr:sigma-70 family RNA polymerase sigma factor [Microbulbifer guangxiensis]